MAQIILGIETSFIAKDSRHTENKSQWKTKNSFHLNLVEAISPRGQILARRASSPIWDGISSPIVAEISKKTSLCRPFGHEPTVSPVRTVPAIAALAFRGIPHALAFTSRGMKIRFIVPRFSATDGVEAPGYKHRTLFSEETAPPYSPPSGAGILQLSRRPELWGAEPRRPARQ